MNNILYVIFGVIIGLAIFGLAIFIAYIIKKLLW